MDELKAQTDSRKINTPTYANEAEARRFARYKLAKEISQPTGNPIADMMNLKEALRLTRIVEDEGPIPKVIAAEVEKVDVVEQVFAIARSGGMRPEAADHFVRHLRQARAKLHAAGAETAEERSARISAEKAKARAEQLAHEILVNLADAKVPIAMHVANFETTETGQPLVVDARNQKAHHWAQKLAELWTPNHRGLTFSGPSGCGKTYLAMAILTAVVRQHGKSVRAKMVTERDLLRWFRQSYNKRDTDPYTPSTIEVKEQFVIRPQLLVLDDFGAEEPSGSEKGDWARGQIMDLVEYRNRERKTTIFTTNLTEPEIEKRYDNRILSRITGHSPWYTMAGNDFRQTVLPDSDDPFAGEDLLTMFNKG